MPLPTEKGLVEAALQLPEAGASVAPRLGQKSHGSKQALPWIALRQLPESYLVLKSSSSRTIGRVLRSPRGLVQRGSKRDVNSVESLICSLSIVFLPARQHEPSAWPLPTALLIRLLSTMMPSSARRSWTPEVWMWCSPASLGHWRHSPCHGYELMAKVLNKPQPYHPVTTRLPPCTLIPFPHGAPGLNLSRIKHTGMSPKPSAGHP